MPQRPDGKAAKTERVTFTRPAAERIAKVVRTVESGNRDSAPLRLGRSVPGHTPRQVRAATFTGSWSIGDSKVVTFKYAPTATQTVANLSWPITHNHNAPEDCIVGKEGTSWWLVVPVLQAQTAVFVTQTQAGTSLVSIAIAATLNTNNCAITVSQTPSTTAITLITATATATYIRLRVP